MREDFGKAVVLIVDDDPTNLRYLNEILCGRYLPYLAPSGERALLFLAKRLPDLILLDLEMPGKSGYDVLREIKANPVWADIPVIAMMAHEGRDREQQALDMGAVDYVLKPIAPGIVQSRVSLHIELMAYRRDLDHIVQLRTAQLRHTQDAILDILASMTSFRDNETGNRIKRTTDYSEMIIENLRRKNHPQYQVHGAYGESIVKAAKLHDIGKVAVPDHVLLKPTQLTRSEFELIKQHAVYGAQILDQAIDQLAEEESRYFLTVARELIATHHEKWNGSGYPLGLSGERIPLSGRVLAIVDVYDALISPRPYKKSLTHEEAVGTMKKEIGTYFDPTLMDLSMNVIDQFGDVTSKYLN